mmetsp:Transcript_22849/g.38119  ORF Transcript_22849/g.38119 Transcript_22849/m.38119 type:complete len:278 (+) Transcript_22849:3302-4135(+)
MLQVRAATQVLPVAVPIHAQRLVTRNGVDQLDLIGLAPVLVILDRHVALPHFGADRLALVDDLFHLFLDHTQIFGGEGFGPVKVIVPAVFDDRADGDLGVGPDFLHGARHDVGQIVADQLVGLVLVGHGMDGDLGVGLDGPGQIPMLTIYGRANRLFGEALGNAFGDRGWGYTRLVFARIAIGKGERDLGHIGILVSLAPTERPVARFVWASCDEEGSSGQARLVMNNRRMADRPWPMQFLSACQNTRPRRCACTHPVGSALLVATPDGRCLHFRGL